MKPDNTRYAGWIAGSLAGVAIVILLTLTRWIGISAIIVGAALVYALLNLATLLYRLHKSRRNARKGKDIFLKITASCMALFLASGAALYLYTFYLIGIEECGVDFNNAEYLLRALICSLDMFMLDVDSNVLDLVGSHPILKGAIVTQAVLSFACTAVLLISLVFSRLRAYIRLRRKATVSPSKKHLYLFFGINRPSEILAADIHVHDPRATVIFIEEAAVDENESDGWNGIVRLLSHRSHTFDVADSTGAYLSVSSMKPCDLSPDDASDDVFDTLNIPHIRRLIEKLSQIPDGKLRLFFLSDNEDENIRGVSAIAADKTIHVMAKQTEVYCHTRYSPTKQAIEDIARINGLKLSIVDSSHLAVEMLKKDIETHPVNVVKIDPTRPTMVSSALTCLIVGFGEVGRDALRFLYEFGAFVDSRSQPGHPVRSPFECRVIDSRMREMEGMFRIQTPAIFSGTGNVRVTLEERDFNHSDFFDNTLTPGFAARLNYVVIAIRNADKAMAMATTIFTMVRKYRYDISDLRIMVRCADDSKATMMQRIADHFNHGYGNGKSNEPVIRLFGQSSAIYSYDTIIDNRFTEEGKRFYARYARHNNDPKTWQQRYDELTSPGNKWAPADAPGLDALRRLRRQTSQDMANALHAATKINLLRKAMPADTDWAKFVNRYFGDDGDAYIDSGKKYYDRHYTNLTPQENEIIHNLALLEHMRWNASHEILGYTTADASTHQCVERTYSHNCLRPCEELIGESEKASCPGYTEDYVKYDYLVVDTTIDIHFRTQQQQNDTEK